MPRNLSVAVENAPKHSQCLSFQARRQIFKQILGTLHEAHEAIPQVPLCWDTHCWSLNSWEEESLVPNVNIIFGWFIITTEIHGRVLHDDNDETATIGSS